LTFTHRTEAEHPAVIGPAPKPRLLLIALLTSLAMPALMGCGGSSTVVSVHGLSITKAMVDRWIAINAHLKAQSPFGAPAGGIVVPDPPSYKACIAHAKTVAAKPASLIKTSAKAQCEREYDSLKQEALGFLILTDWVANEASRLGIKVSDQELQARFKQASRQQFPNPKEFQRYLRTNRYTVTDWLMPLKRDMLVEKIQELVAVVPNITHRQIADYYNQHKREFIHPDTWAIPTIRTKTHAQAEKAKHEIKSGKSLKAVAKKYLPEPPEGDHGCSDVFGHKRVALEEEALEEAVKTRKSSALSSPLKTRVGYCSAGVEAETPFTKEPLAQVQSQIREHLIAHTQAEALTNRLHEKWRATTDCANGYVVPSCKQYAVTPPQARTQ
jgi:hypothetical protein